MSYFSLGIDPDSHHTAIAVTTPDRVVAVKVVEVGAKHKGQDAVARMIEALAMQLPPWLQALRNGPCPHLNVIVAEGQQIYGGGKTKNWDSVVMLGPITGAAAALCRHDSLAHVHVPKPVEWKGDIPKAVSQARILKHRGFGYLKKGSGKNQYCIPAGPMPHDILGAAQVSDSAWKHVVDAIGLADWGMKQNNAGGLQ